MLELIGILILVGIIYYFQSFCYLLIIGYGHFIANLFGVSKETKESAGWSWVCFYGTAFLVIFIISGTKSSNKIQTSTSAYKSTPAPVAITPKVSSQVVEPQANLVIKENNYPIVESRVSKPVEIYTDTKSGLSWTKNGNIAGNQMDWESAVNWAKKLQYAGYTGWRLPSIQELEDLEKQGGNNPVSGLRAKGFHNIQPSGYWSSSVNTTKNNEIWYVNMEGGDVFSTSKFSLNYVLAVGNQQ